MARRAGCRGIVALGSLGEAATLTFDEKVRILETCKRAVADACPVIAGVAGLSTAQCVELAKRAAAIGCGGLMVLPPYVYHGDWRETKAHFDAVLESTDVSCLLYNNPIAYGTDVSPAQMGELARHAESARREGIEWRRSARDGDPRGSRRSIVRARGNG